jgi:histidinol-phosphate aminotransferase
MSGYERPYAAAGGLRLHLNEHTGGCSPRVVDSLRQLDRLAAGLYPEYGDLTQRAAEWFGVAPDQVLLTNGLDEGILATCILALRGHSSADAVIIEPAFDMYEVCVTALAGTVRRVRMRSRLEFSAEDVIAATGPATRVIFLNDPHNPSGTQIDHDEAASIARHAPDALVFYDEAYAEFSGGTFIGRALADHPNVIVGRTFAKCYGLAGLRLGAVIAERERIAQLAAIVPPYSVNAYAAQALRVALQDRAYVDDYISQSEASRELIYGFCRGRGLQFWRSWANFVLIRVGEEVASVTSALAERGVFVRDRSTEPGCEGCLRMTAGRVEDTRTALAAFEEILCGAR